MSILNWPFWYWAIVFVVAFTIFFIFGGRFFPKAKNPWAKNILKLLDVGLLTATCLICFYSFVMFFNTLFGLGFLSLLLLCTGPLALIPTFLIWKYGWILLISITGTKVGMVDGKLF